MTNRSEADQAVLVDASDHLRTAIELLDRVSAPGHIAAHADLALNLLENLIRGAAEPSGIRPGSNLEQMRRAQPF